MTTQQQHAPAAIDPATQVGLVALSVADLARSVAFYTEALGFTVLQRRQDGSAATLGAAGAPLLLLAEQAGARPWPVERATGLYHFAILLPARADLGRWLRHWLEVGYPLPGQGDHLVSEALYLEIPMGMGLKSTVTGRAMTWTWANGQIRMAADPVDIRGLLDEANQAGEPLGRVARPARASVTCISRLAILRRPWRSITMSSVSTSWRGCRVRSSSRPAATTITSG